MRSSQTDSRQSAPASREAGLSIARGDWLKISGRASNRAERT